MSEPVVQIDDHWRIAADPLQWMLQRRTKNRWYPVSFVSSTRDIPARCMREHGVPAAAAAQALARLPDSFQEWAAGAYGLDQARRTGRGAPRQPPSAKQRPVKAPPPPACPGSPTAALTETPVMTAPGNPPELVAARCGADVGADLRFDCRGSHQVARHRFPISPPAIC